MILRAAICVAFVPLASLAQDEPPDWSAAETYADAAAEADPLIAIPLVEGEGTDGAWACASCHGENGQGAGPIPALAGLPAGYIVKQLHDYAAGARLNDNMQYVANRLDATQMAALGAYYAAQIRQPTAGATLGGDLARGRTLALEGDWTVDVPSCFSCHGPSGWGVEQAFPPIAGQHAAYIDRQLSAWKSGDRANSPLGLMHSVAKGLSASDIKSVSDYLAELPPPQPRDRVSLTREPQDE
ncbi:cytochrome c553 [Palleronia aestuarii]|uniref:Cytochrome c553 n=1 Tax=Palleronia aestuarii TaxID=568105 RepID=A0A2W7MYQ9_9RHOB|nr:c-type cytochrome [Palleronia aestuarii]PZX12801.1 cytochrome c553 [Palleronia aestuarii]